MFDHLAQIQQWRSRAAEVRAMAETYASQRAKGILIDLADQYDRLAESEERALNGDGLAEAG